MKTQTRFKANSFVLILLLLCSSHSYAVVISESSVTLAMDWSSLDNYVTWGSSNFKFNGADANLDGITDSNYQTEPGWGGDPNLTYIAQVTPDAKGSANTTDDSANATAYARADGINTSTPPDENVSASGTSHRGNVFTPKADRTVTFSFAYSITQDAVKDLVSESYSNWSIANLRLDTSGSTIASDEIILNNLGISETGTIGFTVELFSSKTYYLEGHVYTSSTANSPAQSVIPEPLTLTLMSIGLASIGYRRKQAK